MVALVRRGDMEAMLSPRLAQALQEFRDTFDGSVNIVAASTCGKYAIVLSIPASTDAPASEPDAVWGCRLGPGFSILDENALGGPLQRQRPQLRLVN
jgi:hypothetical protein